MPDKLEALFEEARNLPREELPRLLGVLEQIRGEILLRMMTPAPEPPDRLLNVAECAERLHVSKDWVYRAHSRLPFVVRGGPHSKLTFSERGLDAYLKKQLGRNKNGSNGH